MDAKRACVIGVEGGRAMGKTEQCRMLKQKLEKYQGAKVIFYNGLRVETNPEDIFIPRINRYNFAEVHTILANLFRMSYDIKRGLADKNTVYILENYYPSAVMRNDLPYDQNTLCSEYLWDIIEPDITYYLSSGKKTEIVKRYKDYDFTINADKFFEEQQAYEKYINIATWKKINAAGDKVEIHDKIYESAIEAIPRLTNRSPKNIKGRPILIPQQAT